MTSILQACYSTRSKLNWPPRNWRSAALIGLLLPVAAIVACQQSVRDQQLDFFALGTEVSISLYGVNSEQVATASRRLQTYFATVGHDWYPWRPGELHQVNEAIANGQPVDVSPALAGIIRRAAEIETLSTNTFSAGLGRLTELWGLHELGTVQQVPDAAAVAALLHSDLSVAAIRWHDNQITFASPGLMLDLGGIAKGAVLDGSIRILQELDIGNAIVNIGGDLSVMGTVNGRPARIGIRSPVAAKPVAAIDIVAGETIVTSGNYERFIEIDGQKFAHILDPRTGFPVEHTASVTVVHVDAMLADAAATALMVGGAAQFDALTRSLQLDYALLIDASGDLCLTAAMSERLHWLEAAAND